MNVLPKGVRHIPAALSADEQRALVDDVRLIVQAAPVVVPVMPREVLHWLHCATARRSPSVTYGLNLMQVV